ncbi:MAG: serine hydrolase [Rhodobacterales bacterium]|nr:serine hydrolase [Rhodobacterales bacterium]
MTPVDILAVRLAPPLALCGIAIARDGKEPAFHIATAPGLTVTPDTPYRAASISKVVTGRVFTGVAEQMGWHPPYTADPSDILGFPLRNPHFPETPLTLGQIASHTASLTDAAGYLIPPDTALRDWFATQGAAPFLPHAPGHFFQYSNLGYVLLAALAEAMSGERFDNLAQRLVLAPLGIEAGFNWSGTSAAFRAGALPTFRRDAMGLHPQIDSKIAPMGPSAPDGTEIPLDRCIPGTNPALFSPQGGLRISLRGTLTLAQSLADDTQAPLWTPDMSPGDTLGGLFQGYSTGLQILPDPSFYPRPLIGHFANAYGFTGGIWYDRLARAAFTYALNGLPMGDEDDVMSNEELAIFAAVAQALA